MPRDFVRVRRCNMLEIMLDIQHGQNFHDASSRAASRGTAEGEFT